MYPYCSLIFNNQRAKKVLSDSLGLVDFAIGLVFFVLNLPDRQVLYFGEIQITEGLLSILLIKKGFGASWNDLWASTCYLQLARMACCKTDFLCTLTITLACFAVACSRLRVSWVYEIKKAQILPPFPVHFSRTFHLNIIWEPGTG